MDAEGMIPCVLLAVFMIVICGVAIIIKAVRTKNATNNTINLFGEQDTEGNEAVKNKEETKFKKCYIVILLILAFDIIVAFIESISFYEPETLIMCAVVLTIVGIPLTIFYDNMSKIIEKKGKRDINNISLFEEELKEDK
jgi:NADH:ubiquinone oxidoreductase subunit 3 (subunit A)